MQAWALVFGEMIELSAAQGVFKTLVLAGAMLVLFFAIRALINHQAAAQGAMLDSERRMLRALIDNIPDFMYVKDTQGRFVLVNARSAEVMGAESVEQMLGKTEFDFCPKELAAAHQRDEQDMMLSGEALFNHEEEVVNRQGNTTHVLTTKVVLRDASGLVSGIAGVGRDISDRKRNEDELREAHQEARIFINAVPSILIGVDQDARITRWNAAATALFGLPEIAVTGKPLANCGVKWQPEMRDEIQSWCAAATARRCDPIPFELGGVMRLLGLTITPVRVVNGKLTELLVIGSDITQRVMLEDQLRQAQKLEAVGQLAAGIAHEINTPTQYIGDNVRFLKDAFADLENLLGRYRRLLAAAKGNGPPGDAMREIVADIERTDDAYLLEEIPKAIDQTIEGVSRVSTLVSAMKEFSHPGTKEKITLDLNHAIESTITVARNEWKYLADLETDFDRALPMVQCQPGEFNQVILNLIVNAAHAIAEVVGKSGTEKGKIRIQTRNYEKYAEIRIEDSGAGIPEKVRSRIFDPFFTTKEIGKGTGQGLAIARSVVVDKHNGTIHFETEVGKGTTFVIRLPHENEPATAEAASA